MVQKIIQLAVQGERKSNCFKKKSNIHSKTKQKSKHCLAFLKSLFKFK